MLMGVLALYVLATAFFFDERGLGFVKVTGTGPSPCTVAMVTGRETMGIWETSSSLFRVMVEPAGRNTGELNGRKSTVY